MAFLVHKPDVPFARLLASFWHGRQFLGAEEGKGKARGRQREGKGFHPRLPSSCCLALMVFLAQKPEMLFARLSASFWHGRPFHGVE